MFDWQTLKVALLSMSSEFRCQSGFKLSFSNRPSPWVDTLLKYGISNFKTLRKLFHLFYWNAKAPEEKFSYHNGNERSTVMNWFVISTCAFDLNRLTIAYLNKTKVKWRMLHSTLFQPLERGIAVQTKSNYSMCQFAGFQKIKNNCSIHLSPTKFQEKNQSTGAMPHFKGMPYLMETGRSGIYKKYIQTIQV